MRGYIVNAIIGIMKTDRPGGMNIQRSWESKSLHHCNAVWYAIKMLGQMI